MFGLKIISEREYKRLIDFDNSCGKAHIEDGKEIERLSKDCNSLRQQLNAQMTQCRKLEQANDNLRQFKRDTLEALANLDLGSFRLSVCKSKCTKCESELPDCKKYTFGCHDFCIIPKQQS